MSTINPDTAYSRVYAEIARERDAQDAKWGEQNHGDGTGSHALKVAAQDARHWADQQAAEGTLRWIDILDEEVCEAAAESDPAKLRAELVQVAAVAVAWIEAIDRRAGR
jgi:hypothetical protein